VNGPNPSIEIEVPWDVQKKERHVEHYTFNQEKLPDDFHSLRVPLEKYLSLTEKPGWLRLIGRDSPNSRFEQTVFMRRQEDFCFQFETKVAFYPKSERQMAGILYFY